MSDVGVGAVADRYGVSLGGGGGGRGWRFHVSLSLPEVNPPGSCSGYACATFSPQSIA